MNAQSLKKLSSLPHRKTLIRIGTASLVLALILQNYQLQTKVRSLTQELHQLQVNYLDSQTSLRTLDHNLRTQETAYQSLERSLTPTPVVTYVPTPSPTPKPKYAYQLTIQYQDSSRDSSDIPAHTIEDFIRFQITPIIGISNAHYRVDQRPNSSNQSHIYLVAEKEVTTQTSISTDRYAAILSPSKPELLPFLLDHKYCQLNTDCRTNGTFCKKGFSNQYADDIVIGCGGTTWQYAYEGLDIEKATPIYNQCPDSFDVTYQGACIQNRCTITQATPYCKVD